MDHHQDCDVFQATIASQGPYGDEGINPEDYTCFCDTVATPERFVLEITLGNAAMNSEEDVADALREVANLLYRGPSSSIYDINGNKVGHYRFETGE